MSEARDKLFDFGDGEENIIDGFYRAQSFLNLMDFQTKEQHQKWQLNTILYIRSVLRVLFKYYEQHEKK
ncbi:MAG: hypothetical protein C4555_03310 [Dehalococcoidia bacterium]|nr:MAG: hypothetical protein C4555_03310 [Dehalococcoidia bacterium]